MADPWTLQPHPRFARPRGPVALIILDGVGLGPQDEGNAWHLAHTPFLDGLVAGPVSGSLRAHGTAVGMPSDADMGNSEVGHNALGAGRVFDQGAKLAAHAVASGELFASPTWRWLMEAVQAGGTLHLIGLWSDGNVHSHIDQAYALMDRAVEAGARSLRVHTLLDGRDVSETSALDYIRPLEARLAALREAGVDAAVASGGGRMVTTMDRYEADWEIVARGWRAHVHGQGRPFTSASQAIETYRAEEPGLIDQYMAPFVIVDAQGAPVGPIRDGDAVVFFNFRGDRAVEITRAFEAPPDADFPFFDRGRVPAVRYAGMMQYDGDLGLPTRYLVAPPAIDRTIAELLARNGLRQLACAETQKFGHVTYFFNGNNSEKFDEELERWIEVPSDRVPFDQRPWMKAAEVTDAVLAAVDDFHPDFIRVNYANGDMVGHTGKIRAARIAMEAVDLSLERLVTGLLERGAVCLVTADHGNADEMIERVKKTHAFARDSAGRLKPRTSHTLNPVPFAVVGAAPGNRYRVRDDVDAPGLANLTATCLNLLGFQAPQDYLPGVLDAEPQPLDAPSPSDPSPTDKVTS